MVGGQGELGGVVGRLLVEAVLEACPRAPESGDGLDGAHRTGAEGEGALCGGFESGVGVGLGQAQDAEAGAVAVLGVSPGVEDRR